MLHQPTRWIDLIQWSPLWLLIHKSDQPIHTSCEVMCSYSIELYSTILVSHKRIEGSSQMMHRTVDYMSIYNSVKVPRSQVIRWYTTLKWIQRSRGLRPENESDLLTYSQTKLTKASNFRVSFLQRNTFFIHEGIDSRGIDILSFNYWCSWCTPIIDIWFYEPLLFRHCYMI